MATFNNSEISEIVRNLKKRGAKIEQATKAAVKESAEEIVRVAKFLAPVRTSGQAICKIQSITKSKITA